MNSFQCQKPVKYVQPPGGTTLEPDTVRSPKQLDNDVPLLDEDYDPDLATAPPTPEAATAAAPEAATDDPATPEDEEDEVDENALDAEDDFAVEGIDEGLLNGDENPVELPERPTVTTGPEAEEGRNG